MLQYSTKEIFINHERDRRGVGTEGTVVTGNRDEESPSTSLPGKDLATGITSFGKIRKRMATAQKRHGLCSRWGCKGQPLACGMTCWSVPRGTWAHQPSLLTGCDETTSPDWCKSGFRRWVECSGFHRWPSLMGGNHRRRLMLFLHLLSLVLYVFLLLLYGNEYCWACVGQQHAVELF